MNKAMKTVKAPLTDGFLLTDMRPRAGTFIGNFKANRKKTTKIVITLLTASVFVFSFMMTGLPMGRHKVLADSSQTRRSKMSPDLENAIVRSPDGVVRIIVDTKPSSNSSAFSNLVKKIGAMGGIVFRNLNKGKSVSVQIPASAVVTL